MFNISYIRGIFPENFYQEKFVQALGTVCWTFQWIFQENAHRYTIDRLTTSQSIAIQWRNTNLLPQVSLNLKLKNVLPEMKVKKLLPKDMESKRFINWLEKGNLTCLTSQLNTGVT